MTATKDRIAVIKGTFMKPGVSKNRRLYTKAQVAEAVSEMERAIAAGTAPPLAMLTHHGARGASDGDVTRTAARITKVGLSPEGNATFEADVADTQAGRDVAALTTPKNPYLKGVSIAGVWKGEPRTVNAPDGSGPCETADGFSVMGIDLTHSPGVAGAEISSAKFTEAARAGLIFESMKEDTFVDQINEDDAGSPAHARTTRMANELKSSVEHAETKAPEQWTVRDLEALAAARG